jgi:cytochrome c-type biogenesis protein CcmH
MIFVALAILAAISLAPLGLSLLRQAVARSRRESALAVHRAQLDELQRDAAEGRIQPTEHASAVLEVQRRLLSAADAPDDAAAASRGTALASRGKLVAAMAIIPLAGMGLYLINGHPELPAAPLAERITLANQQVAQAETLIKELRARLAQLDPKSDVARQGFVLLGNAEQSLGHFPAATAAWRSALAVHFDPDLAAATAELQSRVDGKVSADSAALFRAALAAAPADAPWRSLAEQRLAGVGK